MRLDSLALSVAAIVCIGLAGGPCAALTADQWKALSEKKGCETVPESNLQSTCISRQEGVKGWCKSPACKDTEGLVRTYKQLKEHWDRTSSSAEKTRLQTEIDEKERAIKEERRTLENGVYDFDRCVTARRDVQEVFRRSKDIATYDIDRDEKVKSDGQALALINYWRSEELLHKEAEDNAVKALNSCKEYLNRLP